MTRVRVPHFVPNAGIALIYAALFAFCYVYFLNYYFDYAGYTLFPKPPILVALSIGLTVVPILFYRGMRGVSSFIAVFVYVILYVPIILTFSLGADYPVASNIGLQTVFMVSMIMLFLADVAIVRSPLDLTGRTDLMPWVFGLTLASMLYMLVVYRSNLHFVSFGDAIYEQRFANVELGSDLLTRYLSSWLSTVMIPLCLAYGLFTKRYRFFVAGTGACVLLYMATASKWMILLPGIYGAFFLLFRGGRLRAIYPIFVGTLSLFIGVLLSLTKTTEGISFVVSSLLMMRTIGNGGQLTMAYYDFFNSHPRTEYTHINVVHAITGWSAYPNLGVGEVVGHFFWGEEMNANANFWATDGIAASGLPGVVLISVLGTVLFAVMNSVTRRYDTLFVTLCFLPFVLSMLNTSLFTTVWSGGGFFLVVFFLVNRPKPVAAGGIDIRRS